jgi:tetratricopeptide (TPR) repeat protein
MTCLDDLDVLDYIEGRMPEARVLAVRQHLDGCVECLNLVAQLAGERPPIDGLTFGRTIASGGMGVLIEAFDEKLERRIAVKLPRTGDASAQRRFAREVKITARLQHPAIVPVYAAGTLDDGEPYYAMRLVDGETLEAAIARAPTLAARLALVRPVATAAGAIAYAHSQGVVHRDVKPANVLLGQFGEVVVIDWGIARADGDADAVEVAGTPAYMAPEQARGEPVDARADVYALGAMLAHVLAGKPPGRDGVTLPPELPRDLAAIVAEAMAPDPDQRYRSAAELAADLERFLTGQLVGAHAYSLGQLLRRWMRKHRAVLTASAVAAVALVVVGGVAVSRIIAAEHVADAQRRDAVANRADAEELMDFMLTDMRDKLTPIGKLDVLDAVARKATTYYERRTDATAPDDLNRRANALQNLGDVLVQRGDLAGALREYQAALATTLVLTTLAPGDEDYERNLAISYDRVGEVQVKQGDEAAGLASYRASLAISERLAAHAPSDMTRQRDLAVSHTWIGGALLLQGKRAEALAEMRIALALDEKIAASDPRNATWQRDLSVGVSRVGDVLLEQGDLAGAIAQYRRSLALDEQLAAAAPDDTGLQLDVLRSQQQVAEVVRAQGDADGALALYRASQVIGDKLVARDPSNAVWQRSLEIAFERIGEVQQARGDLAEALVAFRRTFAIAERLAAADPTDPRAQRDLSVAYDKLGSTLVGLGKVEEGLPALRESLALAEKFAAADPAEPALQRDVLVSKASLGDAYAAARDLASAIAQYRGAVALAESLVGKHDGADADLASVRASLAELEAKQRAK